MTILHRSFVRCAGTVLFWLSVATAAGYLWQGYGEHHWWSLEYIAGLGVPFVIATVFIWMMFVPAIQFSGTEFTIQTWWRGTHTMPWTELEYFGQGGGVFLLQFEGRRSFQVFSKAYARKDWAALRSYVEERWPECKSSGWIASRGFKRRK